MVKVAVRAQLGKHRWQQSVISVVTCIHTLTGCGRSRLPARLHAAVPQQ